MFEQLSDKPSPWPTQDLSICQPGRSFIGFEQSAEYCSIAAGRFAKALTERRRHAA
jgi:DNA modification methylase